MFLCNLILSLSCNPLKPNLTLPTPDTQKEHVSFNWLLGINQYWLLCPNSFTASCPASFQLLPLTISVATIVLHLSLSSLHLERHLLWLTLHKSRNASATAIHILFSFSYYFCNLAPQSLLIFSIHPKGIRIVSEILLLPISSVLIVSSLHLSFPCNFSD